MTVLLRRTIRDPLRRCRPEKILNVFQRIRLRIFRACGLASGRGSFASSRTAMLNGLLPSMSAVLSHSIVRSLGLLVLMLAIPSGAGWSATVEVYDGPDDAPLDRLTTLSRQATRYLYCGGLWVALSPCGGGDGRGEEAGGDVRLISDLQRTEDVKPLAARRPLQLADIPILVNHHDGLMHLKEVVLDDEVNASGSMNHTPRRSSL